MNLMVTRICQRGWCARSTAREASSGSRDYRWKMSLSHFLKLQFLMFWTFSSSTAHFTKKFKSDRTPCSWDHCQYCARTGLGLVGRLCSIIVHIASHSCLDNLPHKLQVSVQCKTEVLAPTCGMSQGPKNPQDRENGSLAALQLLETERIDS
jgi:hypothetical protein